MKNKQIIFNVELARPTKVKQGIPPTVFTNDTNTVEFIFNVTDLEVPETATAEVNIFMRDGSFFQKDALVEGSEIRYTLSDTEGKHAGMAQIQMTLSYENKRYSTSIFQFKIDSGLNDKVAVEVLIQNWDTITTEARQYLEQLADYGTEFSEIIADARAQVNANVVEGAVENKFNALEAEYAQDITSLKQSDISLTAQLQQNTVLRPFSMRTNQQEIKPVITIIDDDGRTEAYTILREIALEKGFRFNSAIYADPLKKGEADTMSVAQLITLQSEGSEILSHGWLRNAELALLDTSLYHRELGDSKLYLESVGLNINSFVYQGGSYNDDVLNAIPYYYDSAFTVEPGINNQANRPLDGYKIKRHSLDNSTLAQAKGYVDNIFQNGGWLVFTTHVWYEQWATPEKQQDLKDLIDYINSKSIEIVTVKEGLEIHGNIVDYGVLGKNFFKVNKQGKIFSKYVGGRSEPENTIFVTTPPNFFGENTITVTSHNGLTTATGFPDSNLGTLITIKGLDNLVEQTWYPYFKNNVKVYRYKRTNKYPNYGTEWNDWIKENTYNVVTQEEINGANPNISTYPSSSAGRLLKSEITGNGYYTEEYDIHNSPKKYKRYKKSDGSMSEWREYCFKKDKAFSQLIPSIAQGAFLDVKFDISDLSLTVSDAITLNFAAIPHAGVMWSYYHDGTNITLRLYNFGAGATTSQTIYVRAIALIN